MAETTPAAAINQCEICQQTFARREHLTRHIRTHTREKPFKCRHCSKAFSRLDVLNRHLAFHEQTIPEIALPVSSRACTHCAASRVRCSKGTTCNRCLKRKLDCSYPAEKRPRSCSPDRNELAESPTDCTNPTGPALVENIEPSNLGTEDLLPAQDQLDSNQDGDIICINDSNIDPPTADMSTNTMPWIGPLDPLEIPPLQHNQPPLFYSVPSGYEINAGDSFNQLSAINWLSPEYQESLFLEGQPWGHEDSRSGSYDLSFLDGMTNMTQQSQMKPSGVSSLVQDIDLTVDISSPNQQHSTANNFQQHDQESTHSEVSSTAPESSDGRMYVDGAGSRLPFQGRSLATQSTLSITAIAGRSSEEIIGTHVTVTTDANLGDSQSEISEYISDTAYDNMLQRIHAECRALNLQWDVTLFPLHIHIKLFTALYFTNFHPNYPFLRRSDFLSTNTICDWISILAVSVVGAKYAWNLQGSIVQQNLLHLLHEIVSHRIGMAALGNDENLWMPPPEKAAESELDLSAVQAAILCLICMLHSGKQSWVKRACSERYHIIEACRSMGLLNLPNKTRDIDTGVRDEISVSSWLEKQAKIRTGMMIWLLDSVFAYEFNCKHLMQLVDAGATLPCKDDLWENPSAERIATETPHNVTLLDALELLYLEKKLVPNISDFSANLLISAICRRTKEVIDQNRTQLWTWTPSAKVHMRNTSIAKDETWPPSTPQLSKWRNSACDSLDIIHWCANGRAALAWGWEHPAILHLHLSRLLILAPIVHMQALAAESLASEALEKSNSPNTEARNHIVQWAVNDQYKARLCIVHAGALFWHVRRYRNYGFMEPFAVYTATLVVWAYSVSMQLFRRHEEPQAQQPPNTTHPPFDIDVPADEATEEDPEPSFIHLDRPLDDEMVQTYVRLGHKMAGYMLRVGNICDRNAPLRVLQEGTRLLTGKDQRPKSTNSGVEKPVEGSQVWGIEQSFIALLRSLMTTTKRQ